MEWLVLVVVVAAAYLLLRKRRKSVNKRYARSRLIGRAGTVRPARYCRECDKVETVCRRDEARDTHAEGMLGPRRRGRYGRP